MNTAINLWEAYEALTIQAGRLKFQFKDAEVLEPDPQSERSSQVFLVSAITATSSTSRASFKLLMSRYPKPPNNFELSPDVDTLCYRYQAYRQGREPLQSMAYFCVNFVEKYKFMNLYEASKNLKFGKNCIEKIKKLSSGYGDRKTARKAENKAIEKPLSPDDRRMLEDMVKHLILRMGEYEYWLKVENLDPGDIPAKLDLITMADFT